MDMDSGDRAGRRMDRWSQEVVALDVRHLIVNSTGCVGRLAYCLCEAGPVNGVKTGFRHHMPPMARRWLSPVMGCGGCGSGTARDATAFCSLESVADHTIKDCSGWRRQPRQGISHRRMRGASISPLDGRLQT